MEIERPEDDDIPVAATSADRDSAHGDDAADIKTTTDAIDAGREPARDVIDEPSAVEPGSPDWESRFAYHAEHRAKVDAVYLADARRRWEDVKPGLAEEWHRYAGEHSTTRASPPDLDEAVCAQIEHGCKEMNETEENIITPTMARIEAEDPERNLVGLEFRCKGQDRIMEKVANWMAAQSELTPEEALAMVKDPIRYTFQYSEEHYTEGVYADVERLEIAGFELVELRNSWESETYRGINTRWRVPENEQLFEVQFHTKISFEAKQLTHPAYERFRNASISEAAQNELVDFQRRVNIFVPEPQRAREIPDFP